MVKCGSAVAAKPVERIVRQVPGCDPTWWAWLNVSVTNRGADASTAGREAADSTENLKPTMSRQMRSMRISSSMTLETWGIPLCGTAPR